MIYSHFALKTHINVFFFKPQRFRGVLVVGGGGGGREGVMRGGGGGWLLSSNLEFPSLTFN